MEEIEEGKKPTFSELFFNDWTKKTTEEVAKAAANAEEGEKGEKRPKYKNFYEFYQKIQDNIKDQIADPPEDGSDINDYIIANYISSTVKGLTFDYYN